MKWAYLVKPELDWTRALGQKRGSFFHLLSEAHLTARFSLAGQVNSGRPLASDPVTRRTERVIERIYELIVGG